MPHQCLKCGHSYPEGSREILKGCGDCGGTRFFFTREPLPDGEREALLRRSSRELKQLLHDLSEGAPAASPPVESATGWVPLDAKSLRAMLNEARSADDAPRPPMPSVRDYVAAKARDAPPRPWPAAPERVESAASTAGVPDAAAHAGRGAEAADPPKRLTAPLRSKERLRVDESRGWGTVPTPPPRARAAPPAEAPRADPDPAPEARMATPPTRVAPPATPTGAPAEDAPKWVEGRAPEVVSIRGPGRYEIDVEGLLARQPIVVAKDGTYMIHLPSVFEELVQRDKK